MSKSLIGVPIEELAVFSRKVAADGAVLIKNEDQVLTLKEGEKVALFGRTQINYQRCGTGSGGSVNVPYTINIVEGLRESGKVALNEELVAIYEEWIKDHPFDNGGGGWAAEPWFQEEMPLTDEIVRRASETSKKAIVVIGRTAGEDKDNLVVEGSYLLTSLEQDMLHKVTTYFEEVIVVLNVSNIIDMKWMDEPSYKHPIKGVIYVWQGGMIGGYAVSDVLTGQVTPNGKLADTIAYDIEDYPSTANYGDEDKNHYQEDIYVGYRYFETFCPDKVRYPFGYGLSYTSFEMTAGQIAVTNDGDNVRFSLAVKVKNTGSTYAGKEVVQLYCIAPQGKMGRPVKELVAFKKTGLIKPNGEEEIVLEWDLKQLASYDDAGVTGYRSAYVVEAGIYEFVVGNSVRNVTAVKVEGKAGYEVAETKLVEQLEEALAPLEAFTRMKPGAKKADGTYELTYEPVPVKTVDIRERITSRLPKDLTITGNRGYKLKDVAEGKATMEDFIAQLAEEELAAVVRGEGMSSPLVTSGTASIFGGVSEALFNYGLSVVATADGPSGIRMESGLMATQIPIGTLIACTWDIELIEALHVLEGNEYARNEIDVMLGPGMNLKRNPLNGRNFEYFSEDPFLTGSFAVAIARGLHEGGAEGTLKHFACNNQEIARQKVEAVVSERALREIYLKGFEMAVKEGGAKSIMTTYNPLNGYWNATNYDLNTTILRGEWGFDGIVMTDWWAQLNDVVEGGKPNYNDTSSMVRSQNDLYMVVNNYGAEVNSSEDNTLEGLKNGRVTLGELQRSAMNICRFIMNAPAFNREQIIPDEVRSFTAVEKSSSEKVYELAELTQLDTTNMSEKLTIHVAEEGIYRLIVELMSPDTNFCQTACNVKMNDELVMTVQNCGTYGKWIKQKLVKVSLTPGYYEVALEVVKPRIEIRSLTFKKL